MKKSLSSGRRRFLKGLAATGGGAALAGVAASTQAALDAKQTPAEERPESQGYRVTAHIREYYQKARF